MKKVSFAVSLFAIVLAGSVCLSCQTPPNLENGFKHWGSYDGGSLDSVNLMNGNVMLHAPIIPDYPQRGKLTATDLMYATSKAWQTRCFYRTDGTLYCYWYWGGSGVWF